MTKSEQFLRGISIAAKFMPAGALVDALAESLFSSARRTVDEDQQDVPISAETISQEQAQTTLTFQRAQVARELAIARRIDTAEEVEIEEFFDISGKGQVGFQTGETGLNMGISGEGKKLSRRIYRFKGWRAGGLETLLADLGLSPEERATFQKLGEMDSSTITSEEVHGETTNPSERGEEEQT